MPPSIEYIVFFTTLYFIDFEDMEEKKEEHGIHGEGVSTSFYILFMPFF